MSLEPSFNSNFCNSTAVMQINAKNMFQLVALIFLNICIIFGNGLVILAVIFTKRLRTLTSYLITSLAAADLMIGLAVLPFSTINTIYEQWIFGEVWCQIWLAIDVWMCTASIYNLTAIGIDRFVAIVKPLLYPSIITPKRGKILICGAWLSSFIICFPPIVVQWPQIFSAVNPEAPMCQCSPMDNSPGYIVFSALGSFHVPMIAIISLYVRIYWTVRRSAKSYMTGYISMSKNGRTGYQLRMHIKSREKEKSDINANSEQYKQQQHRCSEPSVVPAPSPRLIQPRRSLLNLRPTTGSTASTQRLLRRVNKECFTVASFAVDSSARNNSLTSLDEDKPSSSPRGSLGDLYGNPGSMSTGRSVYFKKCRANFVNYQKKMTLEIRAAKTVAIVTLCFIFCWLGFSVIYLLKAFPSCHNNCIPEIAFSICFWLGYANSALNPFIYAVFNKEFRRAFRTLLCCSNIKTSSRKIS